MLLLDTCTAIWLAEDPANFPAEVRTQMERAGRRSEIFLSPISAWEIGLLAAANKITITRPIGIYVSELYSHPGVAIAPLTPEICWRSNFLPGTFHRDPADRMLVATAREMNLTLVTRDRKILGYAAQGHLKALSC